MKTTIRNVMLLTGLVLLFSCDSKKTQQNDFDTKAIALIHEFYNKYVFAPYEYFAGGDESFKEMTLNNYCTKKLMQGELYWTDYDEPFFCLNSFVNGSQDYGIGDRVTDIEALGDGKYKVNYINLGNKGTLIIKVVEDDGILKIDEIIY